MSIIETNQTHIQHRNLNQTEQAAIEQLSGSLYEQGHGLPEHEGVEMGLEAGAQASELLNLAEDVGQFATHKTAKVLVIHGPEVDTDGNLPPTPEEYAEPEDNPLLPADYHRLAILGMVPNWYPYGYTSQQPGNILNNVIAMRKWYGIEGVSANAEAALGLHTEDASFNHDKADVSPDFITQHFLRNPDGVAGTISAPDLDQLDDKTKETLFTPFFHNATNYGQGGKNYNSHDPVSILYGERDDPWMRLNIAGLNLESYTKEQRKAVEQLCELAVESTVELVFSPGDIVLIDNRRAFHGRASYQPHQMPRFDGRDRWQRRLVVADDASRIKRFEAAPHIVDPHKMLEKL